MALKPRFVANTAVCARLGSFASSGKCDFICCNESTCSQDKYYSHSLVYVESSTQIGVVKREIVGPTRQYNTTSLASSGMENITGQAWLLLKTPTRSTVCYVKRTMSILCVYNLTSITRGWWSLVANKVKKSGVSPAQRQPTNSLWVIRVLLSGIRLQSRVENDLLRLFGLHAEPRAPPLELTLTQA